MYTALVFTSPETVYITVGNDLSRELGRGLWIHGLLTGYE